MPTYLHSAPWKKPERLVWTRRGLGRAGLTKDLQYLITPAMNGGMQNHIRPLKTNPGALIYPEDNLLLLPGYGTSGAPTLRHDPIEGLYYSYASSDNQRHENNPGNEILSNPGQDTTFTIRVRNVAFANQGSSVNCMIDFGGGGRALIVESSNLPIATGGFSAMATGTTALNNATWRTVTGVISKSESATRLYVDGILEGTAGVITEGLASGYFLSIGGEGAGSTKRYCSCDIAWAVIHTRALSTADVIALHRWGLRALWADDEDAAFMDVAAAPASTFRGLSLLGVGT